MLEATSSTADEDPSKSASIMPWTNRPGHSSLWTMIRLPRARKGNTQRNHLRQRAQATCRLNRNGLSKTRFLSFPLVSSCFLSLSCCFLMFPDVSCFPSFFPSFSFSLLFLHFLFPLVLSPLVFCFPFFLFPFSPFPSLLSLVVPLFEYCLNRQCSARSPDPLRWKHTLHPNFCLEGLRVNLLLPCLPIVDPSFLIGTPRSSGFHT